MSNQNVPSNLVVELSIEEQQLLSGGHNQNHNDHDNRDYRDDRHDRRRRRRRRHHGWY
ncbi:MAG: hypothetical protein HGA42_11895 [Nostocales cyanobacterium W4_Combined_metabat2_030]|jgi:hypothetical protein|nr:hypothetical protein [Nostocales cyanobacterium W4_Combined_metabat2_030]